MVRVTSRSGRLSGQAIDDGLETVRLTVLAFVLLDLVSTLTALSYGISDFGPSGPVAAVQMLLVTAAAATTMWWRTRAALVLTGAVVVLEFAVAPSGMEPWLVLITGVTIAARGRPLVLALGALAHLAYGVGFGVRGASRYPGSGVETGLVTVAFSTAAFGVGLLARLLLDVRDRWWSRVRELERGNAEIRAVERRRLADDLQTAVTSGLTEIGQVVAAARQSAEPAALQRGLSQVDALSRSLLAELRVLLEVLRSEYLPDEPVAPAGRRAGGRRWVDLLTARHVRFAAAAVFGLSALRVLVGHLLGAPGLPTDALAVELISLMAWALAALRPAAGVPCGVAALVVSSVLDPSGYWDVLAAALLCLVTGVRFGPRGAWLVVLGLGGYAGVLTVRADDDPVAHLIVLGYVGGLAWVGGLVARHFLLAHQSSRRQVDDLMEERPNLEGQERSALARELHDVVAHQVSLATMAVLATSWSDDQEILRGTLDRVQRHTEAARSELDTLLVMMRGPWSDQARPTPLLTSAVNADVLARRLADHGFTPVMSVDAEVDALDDTTQRTLGRIMQEGATNILRYAPAGSRCSFTVTVAGDQVRLAITSPRTPGGRASDVSLGWGLRGIRERVELVHGTFRAGPDDRSWTVAVTLPVLRVVNGPPAPSGEARHQDAALG